MFPWRREPERPVGEVEWRAGPVREDSVRSPAQTAFALPESLAACRVIGTF